MNSKTETTPDLETGWRHLLRHIAQSPDPNFRAKIMQTAIAKFGPVPNSLDAQARAALAGKLVFEPLGGADPPPPPFPIFTPLDFVKARRFISRMRAGAEASDPAACALVARQAIDWVMGDGGAHLEARTEALAAAAHIEGVPIHVVDNFRRVPKSVKEKFPADTQAKLIPVNSPMRSVEPAHGPHFTLEELQGYVGGYIEVLRMPGVGASCMVINESGKLEGLPVNIFASALWQEGAAPGNPRRTDPIVGNALLCRCDQLED